MPSAQVIDFGPSLTSEAIGRMAQGFSNTIFDRMEEKRNKELLDEIDKMDLPPEKKILEVARAYGVDPSYKQDRISSLIKVAEIEAKKEKSSIDKIMANRLKAQTDLNTRKYEDTVKGTSPQAIKDAAIREENRKKQELQDRRLEQQIKEKAQAYPEKVSRYINSQLKDSGETLNSNDRAQMTDIIGKLVQQQQIPLGDAYQQAYDAIQQKNELIANTVAVPKPQNSQGGWFSDGKTVSEEEVSKAKQSLFNQLMQLYDQGIRSQSELRKIAKSGGWDTVEANDVLQKLFMAKRVKYQPTKEQTKEKTEEKMTAEQRKALLRSILQ